MATHPKTDRIHPLQPIFTAHLFPKVDGMLLELLRALLPKDWEKQTVSPKWKVRDVAAHLLDTALRGVSIGRDGCVPPTPNIDSAAALGAYIDRLNEEGVKVYGRLSPEVLISLMEMACKQLGEYHAGRDPFGQAPYGVSWAGEEKSANWFDTAREYTERWHHQQQIRLAVEHLGVRSPGILTRELYYPVLDCFMRALPFAYRHVSAAGGTVVRITVSGDCGGRWSLCREGTAWVLTEFEQEHPAAEATIPQDIAWRIFTKGIDGASAQSQLRIAGDAALALPALGMVSIVST
ncbi:MAG TPA: maleylpyruvate isomerase N-terminal domain-containing protein [Candidatus Acidoferrum sp.]|nr:maleylpyruvate isomerase N-terminal domain-containing protein [Candidatus Acidoferrum sp.]